MKKITFILFLFFGTLSTIHSSSLYKIKAQNGFKFSNEDPIQFTERGIEFYVFLDGQFDFNTVSNVQNPNESCATSSFSRPNEIGVPVDYDRFGRIRRVGNVFLNYDFYGRIKRIGSILLQYNQFALVQIGGLQIEYNCRGEVINFFGKIKTNECYAQSNNILQFNKNQQYQRSPNNANSETQSHQILYRKSGSKFPITLTR